MALFKILKGSKDNLSGVKATEGYAYFTPDDGKFYIDTANATTATVGTETTGSDGINRICINETIFNTNDNIVINCGDATR